MTEVFNAWKWFLGLEKRQPLSDFVSVSLNPDNQPVIEGRNYSHAHVHLGDASLYAALNSLAHDPDTAAIVIDPLANTISLQILEELRQGKFDLEMLERDRRLRQTYQSVWQFKHTQSQAWESVQESYLSTYENAKSHLDALYFIPTGFDMLQTTNIPPFASLVTYYYPSHMSPTYEALNFAEAALADRGKFILATEISDIYLDFRSWSAKHNFTDEIIDRTTSNQKYQPFLSTYDFVRGQQKSYHLTIQKQDHHFPYVTPMNLPTLYNKFTGTKPR